IENYSQGHFEANSFKIIKSDNCLKAAAIRQIGGGFIYLVNPKKGQLKIVRPPYCNSGGLPCLRPKAA
ncbi:MAG: hypothetical protein ACRCTY_02010, partial [Candidatus Adiutrix sp.]